MARVGEEGDAPTAHVAAADPVDRVKNERRGWWCWFLALAAVCLAWTFATPLFAAPDEQAHLVKAGALMRGQLSGPEVGSPVGFLIQQRVPRDLADLGQGAPCFWHKENVTPNCVVHAPRGPGSVHVATVAGNYPPLYYLLVGWPSRFRSSDRALYLMRVLSALIGAAFLASAFMSAQRLGRWAVLGVAAAATPMTFFLTSVLNPSGVEIASSVAIWASTVALARARSVDTRLIARATVAWVVCVNTRSLTIALVAFAPLVLLLTADVPRRRELFATPARRVCCGIAVLGALTAAAWASTLGRLSRAAFLPHMPFTFADGIHRTWKIFTQSVAAFGLLEVRVLLVSVVFLVMWAILVVVALRSGGPRDGTVLVGLVVASILFPIIVSLIQPVPILAAWQGRYSLPLWVGVPVVAGGILSTSRRAVSPAWSRRLAVAFAAGFGLAQIAGFVVTARRYTVGSHGSFLYFVDPSWTGPIAPALLLVVSVVGMGVAAAAVARAGFGPHPAGVSAAAGPRA